jgi:formylglycine-generating enzyme required for sulfatase activity/class 3 adenylate cyclase
MPVSDPERTNNLRSVRGGKDDSIPTDGVVRRLASILAADISGYSRLMQLDEEGTYARLMRLRRELIEPSLADHQGKLIKYTGDGFLAMFDSPVQAVRCAIVIQQTMVGRNMSLPREQSILYRIGVHLGDVIVEPGDIYGDGVNIAARLEGIATPGEVYVSGGVYEQIKNKLVCAYQSLGDRQVKNITDPVSVYRVLPDPTALSEARRKRSRSSLLPVLILGAIALLGAGSVWLFQKRIGASPTPAAMTSPAIVAKTPEPPALPPAPAPSPAPPPAASPAPAALTPAPIEPMKESPPLSAPPQAALETPKESAPPAPAAVAARPIPEMVSIPGGIFSMGSDDDPSEKPIHRVTLKPFALSKFPVTVREWNACVAAKRCDSAASGKDDAPVANVSWADAQQFVQWLAEVTQKPFRLPTEAEWEYAARGGAKSKFWWGDQFEAGKANCKGCNDPYDASQPLKVGSFSPNPFGLYDMGGNVDQWVADCWHNNYQGAPSDGSAWGDGDCASYVIRSGSWKNDPAYVRASNRDRYDSGVRYPTHGLRVAETL